MLTSQTEKSWQYPVTAMIPASNATTTWLLCIKRCKCSNIFTVALVDDRVQPTEDQLVGNEKRPPLQQLQVPSINTSISSTQQNIAAFSQMFNLRMIGNLHVYNYKP